MKITEIVNPNCQDDKPKGITDKLIERKWRSFTNLKTLATFSREHFHFVHTQTTANNASRETNMCSKLHIGSHLLWIDLDTDVDVNLLKKRFKNSGIKGFFYYTSAFYDGRNESRIRICVVTKRLVELDGQTEYYARQFLIKLGYNQAFIDDHLDSSIYNPISYFAPVMYKTGELVSDYDKKGKSLFIFKGKPFTWIRQKAFQKKLKKTTATKQLKRKTQFGTYGDVALKLLTFENIEEALARANGTITIVFKNIPEKTKGGYYLNPDVDPWIVFHPNKDKIPFYINTKLGKKDFAKYKKYMLKRFTMPDPLKDINKPDREINTDNPYLSSKVFNKKASLLMIESHTGSGKTTSLAKWLKTYKGSVLFISVNRAQAVTTHRSLLEQGLTDFECYIASAKNKKSTKVGNRYYLSEFIKKIKQGYAPNRLICGVLSLHHLIDDEGELLRKYDLVVIDEISTLPRFAVGPVNLLIDHHLRFRKDMIVLSRILKSAKKIIAMDGYVSKPAMSALENISDKKPYLIRKNFKTNKRVELYMTEKGNKPDYKNNLPGTFMSHLATDLTLENKKGLMVIAASYKKIAEEVSEYIERINPGSKSSILLITGETAKDEGLLDKIRELTTYLNDNNIWYLIYSPAITTGVDIPQAKNTNVYHIVSGIDLKAHTHYQMTMRGREAKRYKLLFPTFLARENNATKITYAKADETFQLNMMKLLNSIKFKGRYTYSVFQAAIKDAKLLMGGAATFKYLEEDSLVTSDDSKPVTAKTIQRYLRENTIDKLIDCEGIRTAIRLEKAVIEWDYYDKKYGVLGQYINLLVREGCLVSKQLEKNRKKKRKPKNVDQEYIDKIRDNIRSDLNYKGKIKSKSKSGLYNTKKNIETSQRILSCHLGDNTNQVAIETETLLATVFKKYGFNFQTGNIELSRNDCINMYDFIVLKTYSLRNNIDIEVEKLVREGAKITDRSKYKRVGSLLRLFFKVSPSKGKGLMLNRNKALDDSIRNMTETHKQYLNN